MIPVIHMISFPIRLSWKDRLRVLLGRPIQVIYKRAGALEWWVDGSKGKPNHVINLEYFEANGDVRYDS